MPSASFPFLLSFCFRNLLLEIFSELDQNLRGLFLRQDEDGVRRAASEATQGRGAPVPRPKVDPQVGPAPAHGAPPRPPPTPIKPQLT